MLSINTNMAAKRTARALGTNYSRLSSSVRHLSSGLRVNTASDDAAGLAIRELMRADIATMNQGVRNANDAISLIQTADGALAVIDEKLIRMKELAEQASTGTYDSTQRLIIDSEFQAMASEIDRIAKATDFNSIKLLDGSLSGAHNGSGLNSIGELKVHFGSGNNSAEDYYYVKIADCTLAGLGLRDEKTRTIRAAGAAPIATRTAPRAAPTTGLGAAVDGWWNEAGVTVDYTTMKIILDVPSRLAGKTSPAGIPTLGGFDYYKLPVGLKDVTITSNTKPGTTPVHKAHVSLFTKDGTQLTGPPVPMHGREKWTYVEDSSGATRTESISPWWNSTHRADVLKALRNAGILDRSTMRLDTSNVINTAGESVTVKGITVDMITSQTEIGSVMGNATQTSPDEVIHVNEITSDFVFTIGGHVNVVDGCNGYTLRIEAEMTNEFLDAVQAPGHVPAPPAPPVDPANPARPNAQGDIMSIKTQELAQQGLERLDSAIAQKDQVRAHLGAMQNRLENTVTNLSIQAENLQAAESRISDVDVATEMTEFSRQQILTQSATSMLTQANTLPGILAGLLG